MAIGHQKKFALELVHLCVSQLTRYREIRANKKGKAEQKHQKRSSQKQHSLRFCTNFVCGMRWRIHLWFVLRVGGAESGGESAGSADA
eukprot:508479-Amphidinium_carterae.1